ncbi:alcohol dehydrogenase catalytic domain-containing protein [Actinoplanes sp. NPDC049265]|uniref:alcohol dehydrogenase catalytic domain-containing protein n=1 Tax=Actinoplanes sp. NPDC049265 TaxID=3363902 RepID=UPI00371F6415
MRAVVYHEVGAAPVIESVAAPECPPGGAIVAVRATGVCRSDWHAWRGHEPVALPHIPGHEFAGEVVEVGAGVRDFAVGDRVTSPFVNGCGVCGYCRDGDAQVCPDQTQPGFTDPGSFAELVVVRGADTNLVRLPGDLGFAGAAALGCRFATAFRALTAQARLAAGEWVAIVGCGGVGLSAVLIAKALGAHVIAVDPSPAARARAVALGADHAVEITTSFSGAADVSDWVGAAGVSDVSGAADGSDVFGVVGAADVSGAVGAADVSGAVGAADVSGAAGAADVFGAVGDDVSGADDSGGAAYSSTLTLHHPSVIEAIVPGGVHVTLDAAGSAVTADAAVRSLRRRGRHVQVGLMLGPDANAALPWDLVVARELEIYGSHGMAAAGYPDMLAMVADGRLDPAALVGRTITLDEAPAALMAMDRPAPQAGITTILL